MGYRTRRLLVPIAHALVRAAFPLMGTLLFLLPALAQGPNNVKWSLSLNPRPPPRDRKFWRAWKAGIDPGWHLYSMTSAGAIPTTIKVTPNAAVEKVRVFQAPPKKAYDPNFQLDTETYEGSAIFLIELQLKPDASAGASERFRRSALPDL